MENFELHIYAQNRCNLIPNRSHSKTQFKVELSEAESFEYASFYWEQRRQRHSRTESFNLSFKKSSSKGYVNGQIWSNGNSHVIVLTKTERPGVMCSRKYEKNGERERRLTTAE